MDNNKGKLYIGIDNGSSGSIGLVGDNFSDFILTPTKKEQSYTVAKKMVSRLDYNGLREYLYHKMAEYEVYPSEAFAVLERPLVNPKMFNTSMVACRVLEAEIIALESIGIPYQYTDSKKWQKVLLPHGTEGTPELKKASMDIGIRLFPQFKTLITSHKDADGLLIASWARMVKF